MESNQNIQTVATICSLPSEILTGIFSLVVLGQHCLIQSSHGCPSLPLEIEYIQGPNSLSQVCLLWHRIVMDIPSLWSHIDIALNHPLNPRLVARARAFAVRAGGTPLEVHIIDPEFAPREEAHHSVSRQQGWASPNVPQINPLQDFSFISSYPAQIRSLDFNFLVWKGLRSCQVDSMEYFLARCTPGVLAHYSMQVHPSTISSFIEPADDPYALESVLLHVTSQCFNDVFLGTTHLRLNNLCPHWGSTAYHGLVELRLGKEVPEIHETEFVSILRASPGLRVLHIRTAIEDSSPPGDFIVPVHLEDLEDLEINDRYGFDLTSCGQILRWIGPGSKPLQLTFDGDPTEGAISFCARANITRFFGSWFMDESLSDMIHRCSQLETLALNASGFQIKDLDSILRPIDERNLVGVVPRTKVDTLYLVNFEVLPLEDLEAAVAEYSVQRLVVRNCSVSYGTDEGVKKTSNPLEIRMLLSTLNKCPRVEYLDRRCSLDLESW